MSVKTKTSKLYVKPTIYIFFNLYKHPNRTKTVVMLSFLKMKCFLYFVLDTKEYVIHVT